MRLTRLYFRVLKWRIQNEYFNSKTAFYMNRTELRAMDIETVKELRLFDEGSWTEHISRVTWDKKNFVKRE